MLATLAVAASALAPLTSHEYFLREVALTQPPAGLASLAAALVDAGGELVPPQPPDLSRFPLLVPLTQSADGAVTGLLRWATSGGTTSELPVVRADPDSRQLTWLAASAEKFLEREGELAEAAAEVAAGGAATPPSRGGVEGRVIMKVGPFMAEYETLARGHVASGSSESALITCERNQRCFEQWGRPFAFHARLLRSLDRSEEARDVARHALSLPLWTLGDSLDEVCKIAGSSTEELAASLAIRARGELTPEQRARDNGMDTRTPREIALERAACLLDIATLPGSEKTWESVRPELAERYSEAGMSDFSAFVSPDETFG